MRNPFRQVEQPHYDARDDTYHIEGHVVSASLFRFLFSEANDGAQFEITVRDGRLSFRLLNPHNVNLENLP